MDRLSFLIVGMSSGETSQAYAITKYFVSQKHIVTIVLKEKINTLYFGQQKKNFRIYVAPRFHDLKKLTSKIKPNVIIFCNSKSYKRDKEFIKLHASPFPGIPVFTLDSNWLLNPKSIRYPYIKWADLYFVNFPEKVFEYGLKQNGGYFYINKSILDKIHPIGFIPSYKKLNEEAILEVRKKLSIQTHEKIIFCYFSGYGAMSRPWVIYNLLHALSILHDNSIKVIYIGNYASLDVKHIQKYNFLIRPHINNMDDFYRILSSADLVFQHQGLATLSQAITARIPVISNVKIYRGTEYPGLHPAEVNPFARLNMCEMFYKSSPAYKIAKKIRSLLYDIGQIESMKKAQQTYYSHGEKILYEKICSYISKNKTSWMRKRQ